MKKEVIIVWALASTLTGNCWGQDTAEKAVNSWSSPNVPEAEDVMYTSLEDTLNHRVIFETIYQRSKYGLIMETDGAFAGLTLMKRYPNGVVEKVASGENLFPLPISVP